ncbi:MAG: PEP-utilizing enzyme, partial [Nanoarchaeota archaeon]
LVKGSKLVTKKLNEKIKEHQQQFAHLGYYFFQGKAYRYEDIEKRFQEHLSLSEIDVNNLEDNITKQENNEEETKKVIIHLHLDNETVHNIQILKRWAALSNYVDETYSYSVHNFIKLWLEIAKRLNLSWDELFSLREKEIIQALQNEHMYPDLKQTAAERYKDHALILDGKDVCILVGKALEEYRNTQEKEQEILANITEIKGQIASSGVASGKVRIILTNQDVTNFKRGEILVSVATNPTYMPAMEKATAILTDEGGLLSHAAVVSRELHVPCIVGTKFATRVLKDNDLVEVDATKGIITILKKKEENQ